MWRILDISNSGYFIHVENKNICIEQPTGEKIRVSFSDVFSIIFSTTENSLSTAFLEECIRHSIPVIFCNEKYLPNGMLMPFNMHTDTFSRLSGQINATLPRKKKAWQLIIREKLSNSADVLCDFGMADSKALIHLSKNVTSGDSENYESQGARIYFESLFGSDFTRTSEELINVLLDYGYTVIRSMVARGIVARGLNPSLGVFHSPRVNPYCLVDDLMEPIRSIVDRKVKELILENKNNLVGLTPMLKRELSKLILVGVSFDGQAMELSRAVTFYVMSYFNFIT